MGEINDTLCNYLSIAEHNADFWNGTEFWGKRKLLASRLKRWDKEYYKRKPKKSKFSNLRRDILMHYKEEKDILLGIELMETIDYTIPARIMDYDAQEIKRQLQDISQRNQRISKEKANFWSHEGEFLYGVRKDDRILPIYTVALYCGITDYDGPIDILGLFHTEGLDEDCCKLLKSYPFRLYSLKDLPEERFQTSLREIIAIFKRRTDESAMLAYYLAHQERFQQLDELSIDTMGVLIGRKDLKLFQQEGGGLNMCEAFENVYQKGQVEGRENGLLQAITNLMQNMKLSAEQAIEALGIPTEEREKFLQRI